MTDTPPTAAQMRMERIDYSNANLLEINLESGRFSSGIDIAYPGSSEWYRTKIDPKADGQDGVVIRGKGKGETILDCTQGWGRTLQAGNNSGLIILQDLTLRNAVNNDAFLLGTMKEQGDNRSDGTVPEGECPHPDAAFICDNVRIESEKRWVGHAYNFDHDLKGCEIDGSRTQEHYYVHGYAQHGLRWEQVKMLGAGMEGLKLTCRPFYETDRDTGEWVPEAWWVRGARGYVRGQYFTNWAVTGYGGGIVCQGNGLYSLMVEDVGFVGSHLQMHPYAYCMMFDDGLTQNHPGMHRYYDHNGVPNGNGAANGWFHARGVGLFGSRDTGSPPNQTMNIMGTDSIDGNYPHSILRGLWLKGCAVYGKNSVIGLNAPDGPVHDVQKGYAYIANCNTPEIRFESERRGMDTSEEAVIQANGKPVSEGYLG